MVKDRHHGPFVWNIEKEKLNIARHGITLEDASEAFQDHNRIIAVDSRHSQKEQRFFCLGMIKGKIATVRFTYRTGKIRIIGAGFWRKGRAYYEKKNKTGS